MSDRLILRSCEGHCQDTDHEAIIFLLESVGFTVQAERGDLHARGGAMGFSSPVAELIIYFPYFYYGLKFIDKVAVKLIGLLCSASAKSENFVPAFQSNHKGVELNFHFDSNSEYYDVSFTKADFMKEALKNLEKDYQEIEALLSTKLLSRMGNPYSITFKYDFKEKKWIIRDFESNSPVYFDSIFNDVKDNYSKENSSLTRKIDNMIEEKLPNP